MTAVTLRSVRAPRLLANLAYLSGAEIASKALTFAVLVYLARVAGPAGFGYVEFAGAVLFCAGLIVDQGFGTYGAREIAKAPWRTEALVTEITVIRSAFAVLAVAAMGLFALVLDRPAAVTHLLLIYAFSLLAAPLLLQWVFQGHNRMGTVAGIQILRQLVLTVVVFALVRDASRIWFVALGEVAGVSAAALFGLYMYRRQLGGTLRWGVRWSRQLLREGVPIGLSQMFWVVRLFGATVIVGLIATPEDVGFFGGAMRILIALHAFVFLYYFNLLPSLSRAWERHDGSFAGTIAGSLRVVAWLSALGGPAWIVAAPFVVTLAYGSAFAPAGAALQWLAIVCVLAGVSGHYRFGLIASGQQNVEMAISAAGAAGAVLLVPIGYFSRGPAGAAAALAATEVAVWALAWWWARRRLGLEGHTRLLVRPFAAAALAVGGAWLWPLPGPVARILVASGLLAALAVLLEAAVRTRVREAIRKALSGRALVAEPLPSRRTVDRRVERALP